MQNHSTYELLDFGKGRKLERFGPWVLDRPSPSAADFSPKHASLWKSAGARYDRTEGEQGVWKPAKFPENAGDSWQMHFGIRSGNESTEGIVFQLQSSPFGHVGVFPEQASNWQWIRERVRRARRPLKILNLFAYTGGSTLAAATVSDSEYPTEVVHVDAAKNMVERARKNAQLSNLGDATIRWIVEDAKKFCEREVKRGNQYDAIILDPPSYGHGPKGERWNIERDLLPLLELCGKLTSEHREFLLVTCHSPGIGPAELAAFLSDGIFGHCGAPPKTGELALATADGRGLPSGVFARWPW